MNMIYPSIRYKIRETLLSSICIQCSTTPRDKIVFLLVHGEKQKEATFSGSKANSQTTHKVQQQDANDAKQGTNIVQCA